MPKRKMYQSHRQEGHKTTKDKKRRGSHLRGWSQSAAKGAWKRCQCGSFCLIDSIIQRTLSDDIAGGGEDGGAGTVASQPC